MDGAEDGGVEAMAKRLSLRRRRRRQNVGAGKLVWKACQQCGLDVRAPLDCSVTCDYCTLKAAVKQANQEQGG